ncbi:hypothetical protein D3C73_1318200 [compost metagenome]
MQHLLRYVDCHIFLGFYCRSAEMRGYDNFWMTQERVVRLRRLLLKYVKGCTGNNAAVDRFNQRHFINNTAAGTVDDAHAFFHDFKLRAGNHMPGFGGQRCMHGDEIRTADDIVN